MSAVIDKKVAPVAGLACASVAAAGQLQTGWADAAAYNGLLVCCVTGAGGGTPALTFSQATDAAGAGAKALTALDAGTFAANIVQGFVDPARLDLAGGFRFVRTTATITGGAGTLTGIVVLGVEPRYSP